MIVLNTLYTQLLTSPVEYGLSTNIGSKGEENLRLVATVFVYILRKVYTQLQQTTTSALVGHA